MFLNVFVSQLSLFLKMEDKLHRQLSCDILPSKLFDLLCADYALNVIQFVYEWVFSRHLLLYIGYLCVLS